MATYSSATRGNLQPGTLWLSEGDDVSSLCEEQSILENESYSGRIR